jgi:hypothetical protein
MEVGGRKDQPRQKQLIALSFPFVFCINAFEHLQHSLKVLFGFQDVRAAQANDDASMVVFFALSTPPGSLDEGA